MYDFTHRSAAAAVPATAGPAVLFPLARILALVERRLSWYGFHDWRVRDVVIGAGRDAEMPPVTVIVRGPDRIRLEILIARNGAVSRTALVSAPVAVPARVDARVPSLRDRAAEALASCRESARACFLPPLLELPTAL